jgi:hypothetical protein
LVLGESGVTVACLTRPEQPNSTDSYELRTFCIEKLGALSMDAGLSCRTLRLFSVTQKAPLVTLRFTYRQRACIEALAFRLEQRLAGRPLAPENPDELYIKTIVRPIRNAQALVVTHRLAVVWRLVSYLKPYRTRVMFGMSAAAAITALALVPPFLTGYLIDEVINPVQAGTIEPAAISMIAWLCVGGIALVYTLQKLCVWVRLRLMAELGEFVARDLRTHFVRVEDVYEDFEIRCWKVQTRQGRRTFQTSRDSWPRKMPNGDFLVQDMAGICPGFPRRFPRRTNSIPRAGAWSGRSSTEPGFRVGGR